MAVNARQPGPAETPETPCPNAGPESPFKLLWRRKGAVLLCIALALGAAAIYLSMTPPSYRSTAALLVDRRDEQLTEGAGPRSHPENFLPTQCRLMQSSLILRDAMRRGNLDTTQALSGASDPLEQLKKILTVDLGRRHDIISTSVTCQVPDEAARIANAVVEAYLAHQQKESSHTLDTLKEQRELRQKELEDKIRQMVDFQVTHGQSQFEIDEDNIVIRRLGQITEALTRAELEVVEARYHAQLVEEAKDNPERIREMVNASRDGPSIHEASRLYREEQDLIQAQNRLREMQLHYTQDHPALRSCQEDIANIDKKIENIRREHREAFIQTARDRFELARKKLRELQDSFSQQQQKIMQINTLGAQFALLQTDVDRTRSHVDVLDARIKQLDLAARTAGTVRYEMLEEAQPAQEPVSPNARRILTLALLAGVLLGCGLAMLMEWTDSRYRSAMEISQEIQHPVLATIPRASGRCGPEILGQKVRLDPMGPVAEAVRILNTAIHFAAGKGNYKSVLVTSAEPGEGKSTVASNLAIAMAQCRKRVLLLDADMHRPMQHLTFRVNAEPSAGVTSEGKVPPLEKLLIRPTQTAGLDVLPGGPLLEAAMEVLGDEGFEYLLQRLGKSYDRIVVDAPPLLHVAEGQALAAACDHVVMVVRADSTDRQSTQRAHQTLHNLQASFLGLVLNRAAIGRGYKYRGYLRGKSRRRLKPQFRMDTSARVG